MGMPHFYLLRSVIFLLMATHRQNAISIWKAAVDAARPETLIPAAFKNPDYPLVQFLENAERIIVVGAGKAGAAMAAVVEKELADQLTKIEGWVNVPGGSKATTQRIQLHEARPLGTNQPTEEGVQGAEEILRLVAGAGPNDIALCLISGGGSALLPAPVEGVSLEDKQLVTKLLHQCGATINEMNAVRKHLSRIKGGRLAQAFSGKALFSLIISDVIGDPLDVISSGPTAPDSATFADALGVLQKYQLLAKTPPAIQKHLESGVQGTLPETPKTLPDNIHNLILGNNAEALEVARVKAEALGYPVLNLGSYLEGETKEIGVALAGLIRSIHRDGIPVAPPVCLLSGGETTVTLSENHGLGGRNQEMVLAIANKLGLEEMPGTVVLSGGTDGEDGPTDAAGAIADMETLQKADALDLNPADFLARNDAYHFFGQTGDLLKTGLTQTNVMDVRVILLFPPSSTN